MFLRLPEITSQFKVNYNHGFSLIELVITGAIIAILVGGGIAAIIRFNEKQEVLSATRGLQQLVRSAQTKARAREIPGGILGCDASTNRIVAYHVYAPAGNGVRALVIPICGDSLNYAAPNASDITLSNSVLSFELPSTITLQNQINIDFLALYGGIKNYDDLDWSQPVATYRLTFGSYNMEFSVSKAGEITDVSEI